LPAVVRQISPAEFGGLGKAFADLSARASMPNLHMSPAAVLAACGTVLDERNCIILVVEDSADRSHLLGVWALSRSRPAWTMGLPVLSASPVPLFDVLSLPVVDAGCGDEMLGLMLEHVRASPALPGLIRCPSWPLQSDVSASLIRALPGVEGRLALYEQWPRAVWQPPEGQDAASYLQLAMGSAYKKRLSSRRALERTGTIGFELYRGAAAIAALPRFLALENAGWKGEQGTSIASSGSHVAYLTALVAGFARDDAVMIGELVRDGETIAMDIMATGSGSVLGLKKAFDERLAKFSPGVQLSMLIVGALMQEPGIHRLDSGMDDSVPADGQIWSERQPMAHGLITLGAGPAAWVAGQALRLRQKLRSRRMPSAKA
jgi:hypothetical protein